LRSSIPNSRGVAHRIPAMAEVLAAGLRSRILEGELNPGESLLSEAILMEKYEVSRPALREALRLLEAKDHISVRRGSHRELVVSLPDGGVAARAAAIHSCRSVTRRLLTSTGSGCSTSLRRPGSPRTMRLPSA
jgi:DNA-binding transcriptional MocR family regulator